MPTRWATSSIWFKSAGDLQSICSISESVLATSDKRQEYDLFPICIKTERKVITGLVISDLHTLGHKCICDAQHVSGTVLNTTRKMRHIFCPQEPTVWWGRDTYPHVAQCAVRQGL